MPNGAEEHCAQLAALVGSADGLVLAGPGVGEVGSGRGEVGLELGVVLL